MCGIVGYIGTKPCLSMIINGLKRLEYRGYDSSGVAIFDGKNEIIIRKAKGKIVELEKLLDESLYDYVKGIGHTRWATHGVPSTLNAHPHHSSNGNFVLVHNGIIENYNAIREFLLGKGFSFRSDTDTEVLASLVENNYKGNLEEAVIKSIKEVRGTFGIAVIAKTEPDKIVVARRGSPIIVGVGEDGNFVASDPSAIIAHTKKVIYLGEDEIAVLTKNTIDIVNIDYEKITPDILEIDLTLEAIEKGGFDHFMKKEIFEQSQTIKDAMRGRLMLEDGNVRLGGFHYHLDKFREAKRIIFVACGTSWHSALIGEYMLEKYTRIPVEVEYASEFRYREPVIQKNDVVIAISQSGETADTLAAIREAKKKGATVFGICNVVGSTIARETDAGVYIHAGPEIGVASTKAFTSQVAVLCLLTIMIARMKSMSLIQGADLAKALSQIPDKVERILETTENEIIKIAEYYKNVTNFLYLGRGYNFPVALEGALKLKEISYIHAEGYPAAEMKHGPIALIDKNMPVVVVATRDGMYEKIISNIEEVKARDGKVIAIATEGDETIKNKADHVIYIPDTLRFLTPLLSIIPLQLLAYHIAVLRGCNVDQPRNLAKSVTVE